VNLGVILRSNLCWQAPPPSIIEFLTCQLGKIPIDKVQVREYDIDPLDYLALGKVPSKYLQIKLDI
jgi:hypothetical protein